MAHKNLTPSQPTRLVSGHPSLLTSLLRGEFQFAFSKGIPLTFASEPQYGQFPLHPSLLRHHLSTSSFSLEFQFRIHLLQEAVLDCQAQVKLGGCDMLLTFGAALFMGRIPLQGNRMVALAPVSQSVCHGTTISESPDFWYNTDS